MTSNERFAYLQALDRIQRLSHQATVAVASGRPDDEVSILFAKISDLSRRAYTHLDNTQKTEAKPVVTLDENEGG